MPKSQLQEFIARLTEVERKVEQHLKDSLIIQTNLKWNTSITTAVFITLLGKLLLDYLK